jgi:hypothetical protein
MLTQEYFDALLPDMLREVRLIKSIQRDEPRPDYLDERLLLSLPNLSRMDRLGSGLIIIVRNST